MQVNTKSSLTSPEIAGIWTSYMQDSMALCVFEHFLSNVEDSQIRSILEYAKYLSEQHIVKLKEIFNQEDLTIPQGFSKDDVKVSAPRLFTDNFYLWYLNSGVYLGMSGYTTVLNNVSRPDIREYFSKCLIESTDLYNKDVDLLISKGILIDAPKVEVLKKVDHVKKENFLGGWFGRPRSSLAREVTILYIKILYDTINRALFTGFGQVSTSKNVREFMFKGRDLSTSKIRTLSEILSKENIPVPSTSDSFVTASTTAPFSEKLMMLIALGMTSLIVSNTGAAITYSFRKDLQLEFTNILGRNAKFAVEGMNILIDNGWMEQPPQAVKSEELIKC